MPKNIKTKHIERMFPFEFFDELNGQLPDYVMGNQAFILNHKSNMPTNKRKELYSTPAIKDAAKQLNENNIVCVQPFGEVLFLDVCYKTCDVDTVISNVNRSQIPISILMVQLYDSSNQPIFSEDVSEDTIKQIPEILWDDPNLLIAIITISDDEPVVACLQIPKEIESSIFEDIKS